MSESNNVSADKWLIRWVRLIVVGDLLACPIASFPVWCFHTSSSSFKLLGYTKPTVRSVWCSASALISLAILLDAKIVQRRVRLLKYKIHTHSQKHTYVCDYVGIYCVR